jgi:hypothetical protein
MRTSILALAASFALLAAAPRAHAQLPPVLRAGEVDMVLNGTGARSKYLMQMYVAGLYLTGPSRDAASIVAADAPMAIRLYITSGMVTQEKLLESLAEGFAASTGDNVEPIAKEIEQFRQCFAAAVVKGDLIDLVYLPTHGVVVLKNGKRQGAIAGMPFKQALFGIWLSDNPVDDGLKAKLLGK